MLIEAIYKDAFPDSQEIFTGGGNVYLEIKDIPFNEILFKETGKSIARQLLPYQLTASFTFGFYDEKSSFGIFIKQVNEKLNKEKLRFGVDSFDVFASRDDKYKDQEVFTKLTKKYSENSSIIITNDSDKNGSTVTDKWLQLAHKKLSFTNTGTRTLIPLPVWTDSLMKTYEDLIKKLIPLTDLDYTEPARGNIIGFEYLAGFAGIRTGTDNIAVLKLDIDNLGKLFQKLDKKESNARLSQEMKSFFTNNIIQLLKEEISSHNNKIKFADNIYTVYAGGDDCFFIGAWDAVIEFAITLQKAFSAFEKKLRQKKELNTFTRPITISASVIVVDPHFPVVRFAEMAEEELKRAKSEKSEGVKDAAGEDMKNKISFMGNVFSWEEFYEMVQVKNTMYDMITVHKENRAFLQRIIKAFDDSDTIYWRRCKPAKPFNPAILWRFLYSFRDIRHKDYFVKNYYNMFFSRTDRYYKKYLWKQFEPGKALSQVMPVAARWTELLTRNQNE